MTGVFFTIVCPLFGCLIANGMFASPLLAVLQARKNGVLGELNPVPWVAGNEYNVPPFYCFLK
jgi:hypothetical protein